MPLCLQPRSWLLQMSSWLKNWIEGHYVSHISQALREIHGKDYVVAIEVDENQSTPEDLPRKTSASSELSHFAVLFTVDSSLAFDLTDSIPQSVVLWYSPERVVILFFVKNSFHYPGVKRRKTVSTPCDKPKIVLYYS